MVVLSEARRSMVTEMLQTSGAVTITDLQARFGVSPMTVRRDLAILAERGVARRTHGGAVLPSMAARENSFAHRLRNATDAKAGWPRRRSRSSLPVRRCSWTRPRRRTSWPG